MDSASPSDSMPEVPVYKVGAVVLRERAGHPPEILLVRPKPKREGEVPPFVLPRGSRQYRLPDGSTHDARDDATALAHAQQMEPLTHTLLREIHEEAGIIPRDLMRQSIYELGVLPFASRSGASYPIHWFVVIPDKATQTRMSLELPHDATETRWMPMSAIESLSHEAFSHGYVPIIRLAVEGIAHKTLPQAALD